MNIGSCKPPRRGSPAKSKRYCGPVKALQGKTALVCFYKQWAFAQFSDIDLSFGNKLMGYGWHRFKKKHWQDR